MLIERSNSLDIQRIGDTEEGISAGIEQDSLPFVFEIVANQFYSKPLASMLREITSNAIDSHKEAMVKEPIIIRRVYSREEGYLVEIEDIGIGLSPERMVKIYSNYFSSTKRKTNDFIGGFGLGSKTPLAYNDLFYISTNYDGLNYEFIYHKGDTKPILESIFGWEEVIETRLVFDEELNEKVEKETVVKYPIGEPTDKRNGTTIRVGIVTVTNEYGRDITMENFMRVMIDELAYFEDVVYVDWPFPVTNNFTIYEGKYFKFRSDIDQKSTELHLCIGNVRYSLNSQVVKVPKEALNLPVAIKFEIGELQVTPSRESIRYNEKTNALIRDRIMLALAEIKHIFSQQADVIDSLEHFDRVQKESPKIYFDEAKTISLNIWAYSGIERRYKYKLLSDLNIKKTPDNLFLFWRHLGLIEAKQELDYYHKDLNNQYILSRPRYLILRKGERVSLLTNIYIYEQYGRVGVITKEKSSYEVIANTLGIKETKELGKARTIYEFNKRIDKMVIDSSIGYYRDYAPSQEWINDYNRRIKESKLSYIRKKNKEIFYRQVLGVGTVGVTKKAGELKGRTGILIYGFKEDKFLLERLANNIIRCWKNYNGDKSFMAIQIAKNLEWDIQDEVKVRYKDKAKKRKVIQKTMYCKDFIGTKFYKKLIYYLNFKTMLPSESSSKTTYLYQYKEDYAKLNNIATSFAHRGDKFIELTGGKIPYENPPIILAFKEKYSAKIPLIDAVNSYISRENEREVADYLKYKGIRVRNDFYLKTKKQLEEERRDKELKIAIKEILASFNKPAPLLLSYAILVEETDNEGQLELEF